MTWKGYLLPTPSLPPSLPLSLLLSSTLSSVLSYTSHSCFFSPQLRETELSASPPECPTSTDEKNEALCFQLTCLPLYISQEVWMSGAFAKKTASQSRQDHSFGPHPNPSSAPVLTIAAASVPLLTVIPPPPFPLTFLCCSCFSFSRGSPSHVRIFLQLSPAAPAEPNPTRVV